MWLLHHTPVIRRDLAFLASLKLGMSQFFRRLQVFLFPFCTKLFLSHRYMVCIAVSSRLRKILHFELVLSSSKYISELVDGSSCYLMHSFFAVEWGFCCQWDQKKRNEVSKIFGLSTLKKFSWDTFDPSTIHRMGQINMEQWGSQVRKLIPIQPSRLVYCLSCRHSLVNYRSFWVQFSTFTTSIPSDT